MNLAYAIGRSLIRLFNEIDKLFPEESQFKEANEIAKEMLPLELFPIDMFELMQRYPSPIIENSLVCAESISEYGEKKKNLLISLVNKSNTEAFEKQKATLYYTGKTFPSTIVPTKLCYFVPYIKGKGIRDLYIIKKARVGSKHEIDPKAAEEDYRLVFELEFVKQLFQTYKATDLKIWRTFTDTTLEKLTELS